MSETQAFRSTARTLRLAPALTPSHLPHHPLLDSLQQSSSNDAAKPPDLKAFVVEILDEATKFADSIVPTTFKEGAEKASPPSAAKVRLLSSDLIQGETWFARRSFHATPEGGSSAQLKGSASYAEFESGLFHDHSKHEAEYTPNVYDAVEVLTWTDEIARLPPQDGGVQKQMGGYYEVDMSIHELAHRIPTPLNNRAFAVLLVRAKTGPTSDFVVVQIPVDLSTVPQAMYSNGRHRKDGDTAEKKGKIVMGAYCSVERIRLLPPEKASQGQGAGGESEGAVKSPDVRTVEWVMATASDAKGSLPMAMQKLGVPGAIVKDVGFFIGWAEKQRK